MIHGSATRRGLLAFAVAALLGGVALALAGGADQRRTAFSLQVGNSQLVVTLARYQSVCQGPFVARAGFSGLRLWLGAVAAPGATLQVNAISTNGQPIASGTLSASPSESSSPGVRLIPTVREGARLRLCLANTGPASVPLTGGPPGRESGVLERAGHSLGSAAAMVMLSPHLHSMLTLLPTIFRRASLFRPSWMGAWTYWTLLAAIIVAFPLVGVALRLAARDDAES